MAEEPYDPIPSLQLPHWLERLILLIARVLIHRYLPELLFRDKQNGSHKL